MMLHGALQDPCDTVHHQAGNGSCFSSGGTGSCPVQFIHDGLDKGHLDMFRLFNSERFFLPGQDQPDRVKTENGEIDLCIASGNLYPVFPE